MIIKTITVSSTRKLPHPCSDYASVSSHASLTAELSAEDHLPTCLATLQTKADVAAEQHMDSIFRSFRPQPRDAAKAAVATANTTSALADKHSK